MFYYQSNGSATLPRGFRFHHEEDQRRTPEPLVADELQQPSPPRQRLKLRRRNVVSGFELPTENILTSFNAPDIPIPTIEVPQIDEEMPDREVGSVSTTGLLSPQSFDYRLFSPPKTPVPTLPIEAGSSGRPDWSMSTSSPPPDYLDRPSSALSNASDFSDDSFYSGSRVSRPSDDGSCTSPDSDIADPFQSPPNDRS